MTRVLQAGRKEPVSGETRSCVVFLHGYGANGADLLGLADPLGEHLPDTLFVAPDAPEACAGAPMGFQWFPIPWIDDSSEEEAMQGMSRAVDDLNVGFDQQHHQLVNLVRRDLRGKRIVNLIVCEKPALAPVSHQLLNFFFIPRLEATI